jgi:hypothetical protein
VPQVQADGRDGGVDFQGQSKRQTRLSCPPTGSTDNTINFSSQTDTAPEAKMDVHTYHVYCANLHLTEHILVSVLVDYSINILAPRQSHIAKGQGVGWDSV